MKNKLHLAVTLLFSILIQFNAHAQKPLNEGKIVFAITYPDMEMDAQMLAMMPTESVVFIKGAMSRTELTMGMGISSSSIMNSKTGEVIALTDMMGSKSAMKMTADDVKKSKKTDDKPVITLTSETKNIVGYTCKKAVVKSGETTSLEVYYTDQISSTTAATLEWKEIKGFPMEYFLDQNGLRMKFTAKSVSPEKVSDDMFTIPKEYKLVSQEEMMKKMSGAE